MASTAAMSGALNEGAIAGMVEAVRPGRANSLTALWMVVESSASGVIQKAVVCYPIYQRTGGFMVACPRVEDVPGLLEAVNGGSDGDAVWHLVELEMVTNRGPVLGSAEGFLVDMPWAFLQHLQKVPRTSGPPQFEVVQFMVADSIAKPSAKSAQEAADQWITQEMAEETAQEYFTGEEADAENTELELQPDGVPLVGHDPTEDLAALQRQVRELQQQLDQTRLEASRTAPRPGTTGSTPSSKARPLFHGARTQTTLDQSDWARLQQIAGPPPTRGTRAGVGSNQQLLQSPVAGVKNDALLEWEREAVDRTELEAPEVVSSGKPLEQLIITQVQQNSLLLQRLVGAKQTDPLMAALSGSDSGSGSNSGVKGCVARETYLKTISDLVAIAEVVKQNAMVELGMSADREDSSIMWRFVERKIPLQDHKTLGYIATLAAEGWAIAHETNNFAMMGFLSKLLMFVEQTCLDRGKTQLAWLLTGCMDPAFNLHHNVKQHGSLKPFSSLAKASWVSANIAYLKDLDYTSKGG